MRFLRSTTGVTKQDRLTNEAIRKTLSVNRLNDTISKYRETIGLTTSDEWTLSTIHAVIQTYRKEKSRPPKKEMDKSSLNSRNGQKSDA
jgi:hypothetical protein